MIISRTLAAALALLLLHAPVTSRSRTIRTRASFARFQVVMSNFADSVAFVATALVSAGTWIAVSYATGETESFDTSAYFVVAMPVLAIGAAFLGYFFPSRPWLWPTAIWLGQAGFLMGSNIFPISLTILALLCLPFLATAFVGAALAKRRRLKPERDRY